MEGMEGMEGIFFAKEKQEISFQFIDCMFRWVMKLHWCSNVGHSTHLCPQGIQVTAASCKHAHFQQIFHKLQSNISSVRTLSPLRNWTPE